MEYLMKKNVFGMLAIGATAGILAPSAFAGETGQVGCEAFKIERSGKAPLRGVRVTLGQSTYVVEGIFNDERAKITFGEDAAARDRAGNLCWEVVRATRCEASDRYENIGDPGFGPSYFQKMGEAGTLYVGSVSSSAQSRVGGLLHGYHGHYEQTFSGCEAVRANLAYRALKIAHSEWTQANQPAETKKSYETPRFQHYPYEKF